MDKKVTMLMILDGVGINERTDGNAVALANTPVLDKILKTNPNTKKYLLSTFFRLNNTINKVIRR